MKTTILYLCVAPFIMLAIPFGFIFESLYAGFHAGRSAVNKLPEESAKLRSSANNRNLPADEKRHD